jgi:type I restriction enzyme, S subunit
MIENWIDVELGDVCFTTSGGTPSRKMPNYYKGDIPWVKSGELNYNVISYTEEYISDEAIKNSSAKVFPAGTLLIALYGATIGKSAILGIPAATNQAVCGIYKNELFETKFLYYYLFHKRQKLIEQGTGGAQPNISQTILKKLSVSIAPLPVQRAIVDKIEQLFSELDNGISNLIIAKKQLDIYRQSVLEKAFEGRLTKEWRKNQHDIDSGFSFVYLKEIADVATGATPKKDNSSYWSDGKIPWVTSGALNNIFVKEASGFITEKALSETNCKIFPKETLLIAMYGEGKTRGKCSELAIDAATNQAIAAILVKRDFQGSKKYLKWFFIKNYNDIRMISSGGVQPNLNLTKIKETRIPFPSFQEQDQIVKEIESRLSVCDNILANLHSSLKKAEALRESILKKAFGGKLLNEEELEACRKEPDWEPAEKLLDRISKEKEEV